MAAWISGNDVDLHGPDENCEYVPPLLVHSVLRIYVNCGLTGYRMVLLLQDEDKVYGGY